MFNFFLFSSLYNVLSLFFTFLFITILVTQIVFESNIFINAQNCLPQLFFTVHVIWHEIPLITNYSVLFMFVSQHCPLFYQLGCRNNVCKHPICYVKVFWLLQCVTSVFLCVRVPIRLSLMLPQNSSFNWG